MSDWRVLCRSIQEHPEQWVGDRYYFQHTSGLTFWTANGWSFFHQEDSKVPKVRLGVWGKLKVWWAYRKWAQDRLQERLSSGEPAMR